MNFDVSSYRSCKASPRGKSPVINTYLLQNPQYLERRRGGGEVEAHSINGKILRLSDFSKFHINLFILALFLVNFYQNNQTQASGKLNDSLVSEREGKILLKCVSVVDFIHPFSMV